MDWSAEYAKAADGDAEETAALAFLDLLLTHEGGEWWRKVRAKKELSEEDKKQLKTLKKRLAAVGSQLIVQLPELNASVDSKRVAKVRVLQLQLVCRMLRYGVQKKAQRKQLKKEIRGLLDRVALLLDAANPPSLADEDADERSPFQSFLQQKLAPRLRKLIPELMQYLLKVYELEDAKEEINVVVPTLLPVKISQPVEVPTAEVTGKGSILSALRQERPSKRPRSDANGLFKEVQLPPHLQQKQRQTRPSKSRRVSKNNSTRSSQNALLLAATKPARASIPVGIAAKPGSTNRQPGNSDLLRRANTSTSVPAALLQRTLSERQLQGAARQPAIKHQSPQLRRAASASSVVMGTPDRPKRMAARTTRRVLVEASPPLRRPTAAPRLLQPKSSRPGSNPPPLFH